MINGEGYSALTQGEMVPLLDLGSIVNCTIWGYAELREEREFIVGQPGSERPWSLSIISRCRQESHWRWSHAAIWSWKVWTTPWGNSQLKRLSEKIFWLKVILGPIIAHFNWVSIRVSLVFQEFFTINLQYSRKLSIDIGNCKSNRGIIPECFFYRLGKLGWWVSGNERVRDQRAKKYGL